MANRSRWNSAAVADWLVRLVILGLVLFMLYADSTERSCRGDIAQYTAERTQALTPIVTRERETGRTTDAALAAIVDASLRQPPPGESESRRLVEALQEAQDAEEKAIRTGDRVREKWPVPREPDEVCS